MGGGAAGQKGAALDTKTRKNAERGEKRGRGAAMNDSGSRTPNGEGPVGGPPRAPGRRPGSGTRPRAFLGDARGGVTCGVCGVTLQLGHRAVRFPCGQGRHVLHVRRVVETLARGAARASLRCLTVNCGAQHPRRDAQKSKHIRVSTIGPGGWEGGP